MAFLCFSLGFSNFLIGMDDLYCIKDLNKQCTNHLYEGRKMVKERKNIAARDCYNKAYDIAEYLNDPELKSESLIGHAAVYSKNNLSCFTQAYFFALEAGNIFLQCKALIGVASNTKDTEYALWCYTKILTTIDEINPGDNNILKILEDKAIKGVNKIYAKKNIDKSPHKRTYEKAFSGPKKSQRKSQKKKQKIFR